MGIRSPDGLVVGIAPATPEFWVRFPNERNQGKQATPCVKVPGSSRVPAPPWVGSRSLELGRRPSTLRLDHAYVCIAKRQNPLALRRRLLNRRLLQVG